MKAYVVGRVLSSLLVIHKHTKEETIYQWEGGDVKSWNINGLSWDWVDHQNCQTPSQSSLAIGVPFFILSIAAIWFHHEPIPPFSKEPQKYCHCKILIHNLTGNPLLEAALTLLWHLVITRVMEIVDEDWEGIIFVQGMPDRNNNKGYVCCFHQGFMTSHLLKDEEAK